MKISYAVTVCNELIELQRLLNFLLENKREQDEIVIFYDTNNGSKSVEDFLRARSVNKVSFRWIGYHFDGHFANMKNALTEACLGQYIFQIDADEMPHTSLVKNLPTILESNLEVELYAVPRVNTVEGLTPEHIRRWGWRVDEQGWVNWPDFQTRIYKNSPEIRWQNKVHEVIQGHKQFAYLPIEEQWALYHPKDIKRQERQNSYYNELS